MSVSNPPPAPHRPGAAVGANIRWRRLRRWLRPPRRIRATLTGKFLLIFTVVLGVAAVNTGNNLLYLMLGSLFGLISASGILSERSMRGLTVTRELPGLLFAIPTGNWFTRSPMRKPESRHT